MKELQIEDLASHDHPESCANVREVGGEALTGARTGWILSPEIYESRAPTLFPSAEGNTLTHAIRECSSGPAGSKTPCTCGTSLRGNREILGPPTVMVPSAATGRP
jgi:hypothetical protein